MSSIDRDKHLICIRCCGYECSVDLRCEECESWSKEEMLSHEKIRRSLASKPKGRGKSSSKIPKKPASPPSSSANSDLDDRFAAHYGKMVKDMDDRMELLSSSLLGQIKSLLAHTRPDNPINENASVCPGQAGLKPVPEPPQPQAKSAVQNSEHLVCEGGAGPQALGLAHALDRRSDNISPHLAHAPQFSGGGQNVPSSYSGPRGHREPFSEYDRVDDDDDDDIDDRDSLEEAPVDRAFAHLVDYIYERFPHAEPQTAASAAPRCDYECYFAVADPPEPSRKLMRLYPRVAEIQTSVSDYAANLARESRPLFKLLPSKRRSLSIGDAPNFCKQRFFNSDYARICRSKSVPRSRMASVSLADFERLDRAIRMVLAGDSQCFWFLSSLLTQLKEDGYHPSNPSLFDKSISSLSLLRLVLRPVYESS